MLRYLKSIIYLFFKDVHLLHYQGIQVKVKTKFRDIIIFEKISFL